MAASKRTATKKAASKRRSSGKRIKLGNVSLTQRQLLIGGIVATLLAVGMYFGRTEKVAVTVAISAPNGGVFKDPNGCDALSDYKGNVDSISVTSAAGAVIPISEITWVSVEKNLCEGTFMLSLSPYSEYQVSVDNAQLGSITEMTFSSHAAKFTKTISVTRDLSGTHDLVETASSCTGTTFAWTCSWSYWNFGRHFSTNSGTNTCTGIGGYDDLRDGAVVTVYNSMGAVVGTTTLFGSVYNLTSTSSREIICTFKWELKDVPNDDAGYSVEVTHRGKVFFTSDRLQSNGYVLTTTIGE
jgi:hypothetical protein